jgi:hypothetical protein
LLKEGGLYPEERFKRSTVVLAPAISAGYCCRLDAVTGFEEVNRVTETTDLPHVAEVHVCYLADNLLHALAVDAKLSAKIHQLDTRIFPNPVPNYPKDIFDVVRHGARNPSFYGEPTKVTKLKKPAHLQERKKSFAAYRIFILDLLRP